MENGYVIQMCVFSACRWLVVARGFFFFSHVFGENRVAHASGLVDAKPRAKQTRTDRRVLVVSIKSQALNVNDCSFTYHRRQKFKLVADAFSREHC